MSVAILLAFPPGTELVEGWVEDESMFAEMLGHSTLWAVIHLGPDVTPQLWQAEFDSGYGCGKGGPAADGLSKDVFAPVACSPFPITLGNPETLETVDFY